MTLEIASADTPGGVRRFIDLPWRLRGPERDPWVPPLRVMVRDLLDVRRNPFYRNADRGLFLATRDGRPVGRIAAIENRSHNAHHGDRTGFFGFYESVEDGEVARALLDAAAGWLRARGLTSMRGPMSPSTNHECGLLVDDFEREPTLMTPWNPPWYASLFEGAGLVKEMDLLGFWIPTDPEAFEITPGMERAAERARRRMGRLVFRELDAARLQRDAEICRRIYNEAWSGNWGFVPMNEEEFAYMAKELKPILMPAFSFIAEVDGDPAGFLVAVPDFNRLFRRIPSGRLLPTGIFTLLLGKRGLRTGRVLLLGIRERYRGQGILPLFMQELLRRGRAFGALGAEASWVLEDNDALIRPLRAMGGEPTRRWRIYGKSI